MPRKPEWVQHLDSALDELRSLEASLIDRKTVERLFHIGRSQAHLVLRRFASQTAGQALIIPREEFIRKLEAVRDNPDCLGEARRLHKLEDELAAVRQSLRARRTKIDVTPESVGREFANLPAGIRLAAGLLTVSFETPQDLLRKLFELSQALVNDYQTFERLAG